MDLRAVPVGRGLQRGSGLFSIAPFQSSSGSLLGRKTLGETEQSLYVRARAAVTKFDEIRERFSEISNGAYRATVADAMGGSANDPSAPINLRHSLAEVVRQAESKTPVDYLLFSAPETQANIDKLESVNRRLEGMIQYGESGVAPELSGPSLGVSTSSAVCAAAGLVILGTIVYFAFAVK